MSIINKTAVLNPLLPIMDNIVDYIPRATTSKFGMVAIGSGINVDHLGRIYLDTQEYSDRLTAIEAQAASSLATQKSEVAAAIAQVNLAQSQTITSLTLEVSNLKTNLTASITATQTDLINRADQLAQNVTNITQQLTQDKAAFTKEIQDALVYLENASSVASALRTPRKINGTDFDGRSDITTNAWGATRIFQIGNKTNSINGASNVAYSLADIGAFPAVGGTIQGSVEVTGNLSVAGTISATLEGTAASADKLQTPRTINGVSFDGSEDITLPLASTSVSGTVQLNNTLTSTNTDHALTATQGKVLNDSKLDKTANAVSASKLETSRTISLSGGVTGSVSFDGSANASIATTVTGLGAANGIATLDANGQIPSTQLPSYVDDILEYESVAAFPTTGVAGKIYVETTGNTTYRWGGTGYVKITSGEVSSVAGKVGVVTLTKADVGLANVDNTADSTKSVASASKLTTARTINGVSFDGTSNITITDATKAPLNSANLVGTPTAPTATISTNTTQIATTEFVQAVNSADTGSSATTLKLKTARTIGGVSFDGSTNINLPGVNITGNQSTTGNAATATTLQTARTINGTSFNGSANITTASWGNSRTLTIGNTSKSVNGSADIAWTADEILPAGTNGHVLKHNGNSWVSSVDSNTAMTAEDANAGTATTAQVISAAVLKGAIQTHAPVQTSVAGNAATATKLQTARTINGISFDGTANITLPVFEKTFSSNASYNLNNRNLSGVHTEYAWQNAPVSEIGGVLAINYSPDWQTQLFFNTGSSVPQIYARNFTSGTTWGAWKTLAFTDSDITGNATTATTLQTARTIGGVSFNGSANINLPGVNTTGNQNTTGNSATATKLQTPRTINGVSFDGTANITIADSTKLPLTGGTISGQLVAPNILINRGDTVASGISWYSSSYNSWQDYMAQAGSTGNGVNGNITAPTGTYVNTWARRSVIEPAAGYGWTFETMTMNGTVPTIVAELSKDGVFKTTGDIHGANLTVSGSMHTVGAVNGRSLGVNSTDGSGVGLSLYGGARDGIPDFGIAFAHTSNYGTHGSVVGDWATYFTMTWGSNRGWIFRSSDNGNVASISATGVLTGNQFKLTETFGTNSIANGNGDSASYSTHNMVIRSHWGIGFRDNQDVCRTVLDTRTGNLSTQGTVYSSEVNTNGIRTSNFYSSTAYSFYGPDNSTSQRIKCNSILASNAWADEPYVPYLGIFARGDISSAGNISAWGNVTAYSDKRIKEDVAVIENALTKVEQLNGVTFKRKDTLERQTGLLAQEVEAVLPEAVTRQKASEEIKAITGDEEVLAVNYGALVGLLVESIKELKAEIDVLKEKVK